MSASKTKSGKGKPVQAKKVVVVSTRKQKKIISKGPQATKYKKAKNLGTYVMPTQQIANKACLSTKANICASALQVAHAVLVSGLINQGILGSSDVDAGAVSRFYGGLTYQAQGVNKVIHGEPALETRLKLVNDVIAALSPKTINTMGVGAISYAWLDTLGNDTFSLDYSKFDTAWMDWLYTYCQPENDDGTYNSPATVITTGNGEASEANYSEYLGIVQKSSNITKGPLNVVPAGHKSGFDRDATAFSRVYSYDGLNVSGAGGYYNSIENEVKLYSPNFAGFCVYDVPDKRLPRYEAPISLGPEKAYGYPLTTVYTGDGDYRNKIPIVVKPINLYTIVYKLAMWMVLLAQAGQVTGMEFQTCDLTLQDFTIIVMQALKAGVFKDQFLVQFCNPVDYTAGANNQVPVGVMGHTYGHQSMAQVLVPSLMAENLAALTSTSYYLNGESGSRVVYLPVLTYPEGDVAPIFKVNNVNDPTLPGIPLFKTAAQAAQIPIRLSDGKLATVSPSQSPYVNLNSSYYVNCCSTWNGLVNKYGHLTTEVMYIGNVTPAEGLHILSVTKLLAGGFVDLDAPRPVGRQMVPPIFKNIENTSYSLPRNDEIVVGKQLIKQTSKTHIEKEKPKAIPPATLENLSIDSWTASYPISKEMFEILQVITTGELRPVNGITEDVLTSNMIQVMYREILKYNMPNVAPTYSAEIFNFATLCVKGLAGNNTNYYDVVMRTLQSEGRSGILAGLLGGFAKALFPSAAGTIDTISSIVPF